MAWENEGKHIENHPLDLASCLVEIDVIYSERDSKEVGILLSKYLWSGGGKNQQWMEVKTWSSKEIEAAYACSGLARTEVLLKLKEETKMS